MTPSTTPESIPNFPAASPTRPLAAPFKSPLIIPSTTPESMPNFPAASPARPPAVSLRKLPTPCSFISIALLATSLPMLIYFSASAFTASYLVLYSSILVLYSLAFSTKVLLKNVSWVLFRMSDNVDLVLPIFDIVC